MSYHDTAKRCSLFLLSESWESTDSLRVASICYTVKWRKHKPKPTNTWDRTKRWLAYMSILATCDMLSMVPSDMFQEDAMCNECISRQQGLSTLSICHKHILICNAALNSNPISGITKGYFQWWILRPSFKCIIKLIRVIIRFKQPIQMILLLETCEAAVGFPDWAIHYNDNNKVNCSQCNSTTTLIQQT